MDQNGHVSKKRELQTKPPRLPDWLSDLNEAGVVEMLENDRRPTFVLDLGACGSFGSTNTRLIYCNDSLNCDLDILEQIQSLYSPGGEDPDLRSKAFRQWTLESAYSRSTRSGSA